MNRKRLQDLLAMLPGVPDEQFRMGSWWYENCVTTGCVVGHYIRAYPRRGLSLRRTVSGQFAIVDMADGDLGDWAAVEKHFDLSDREALWLFLDRSYKSYHPSKGEVMARIKDFIASGGVSSRKRERLLPK